MKYFLILAALIMGCVNADTTRTADADTTVTATTPSPQTEQQPTNSEQQASDNEQRTTDNETHSNQRFREVRVTRVAPDSFRVQGEAQIFEASFGWVVEDGHNELKEGFATADMGAPEWGRFDFAFRAPRQRAGSTLHLILFETSMNDGSRVHELPIPLP